MKKLTELFAVFTVSLFAFNACRSELQPVEKPAVTHSLKFVADAPTAKTTADIDPDNKTVDYSWTKDDEDRFMVYEINGEVYTPAITVEGDLTEGKMTLTATFGGDSVHGASYIALFNTGVKSEQSATDTSYDQLSDVLISKPVQSNDIENEELMLQFKRETAFALMTAKNLEGSSIIGASICADKKIVAEYDVQSQSFLEPGSKTIAIANGDNAVSSISNGAADVFFASVPVEGTSLKVRVVTCDENGVFKALYEKSFASGKSIDFARGDVRPFGIQMAKCEDGLTIDLTKDETTTATEDEMSWKIPGFVSIVAEKAGAGTATNSVYPGKGNKTTHFSKNSALTFTPRKGVLISSIVFEAGTSGYADALINSTWTNASATADENNIVTITPVLGYQPVFVVLDKGTTGGDSFKINYGVAESHSITVADGIANGSVSASVTSAVPGTEITLIPSPDEHYYLDTWIVTNAETETPVAVTDNKFIMPNAPVNVSAKFRHNPYFEKLTTAPDDWRGDYLIVYETGEVAFDGSLTTLDAASNTKEVTIEEGNKIEATAEMKAIQFTVDYKSGSSTVYSLKSASGKYISGTTTTSKAENGLKQDDRDSNYEISFNELTIESKSSDQQMVLKYNSAIDQKRFRFYKSGQQGVALYKLGEAPRDLTNIEITTMPTTSYKESECFDPAGLVITKYFDCGDPVTNYAYEYHPSEFSFEPALDTPLETTDTKVTVTVGGKTAEIKITVTEVASHYVTFMSNGAQYGEIEVKEGANITFPATNPSVDGVVFVGWTKTTIIGTQQLAPDMVNTAEEKMDKADITFYAVFAKKTEGSISVLETVGFESSEGYTATTTYNSSSYTTGANGSKWTINYGAFATSGAIIGSQSAQFRVYGSGGGYGQLYNTVAYGEDIVKVSFSAKAASTNGTVKVSYSTNGSSWTDITTQSLTTTTTEYDVLVSASGVKYIKFTAGGTRPSSGNYSIYVDDVAVYSKSASSYSNYCTTVATLESVVVSGTPTKTTYVAGESFEPAGLTVTGHYSDGTNNAITEGITWSTPAALAVGQTFVSITATVNGVTSAAYEVTGLTVTAPVTITGISATGTPSEFWKGDTFNHNGITVKATWSNGTETDVTSSCTFTGYDMSTPGQQKVTVTYQEKTCTYDIEVKTIANTEATAYTVTEAKGIIDAGKDLASEVYVKGKVSKVDSYNSDYKSITYWISEDGATTNQFEVYGGLAKEGEEFTSINDVKIGADVVVKGKIKKFNTTYEFDSNNHLVSYTAPATTKDNASITFSGNETSLQVGQADEVTVTYNGDGVLSAESSNSGVATVSLSGTTLTVNPVGAGSTTITVSAPETDTYTSATKSYNLTVTAPVQPASLPFEFDRGKGDIESTNGMSHSGLGTDYGSSPKLKFDTAGDYVVINFSEAATKVTYTIKGNSTSGTYAFDVMESEDGTNYTSVHSHTSITDATPYTDNLKAGSRYVKFVYTTKANGNVALGKIKIVKETQGGGDSDPKAYVYTFTSKSWGASLSVDGGAATTANWTSGKDGGQLTSNMGIQVSKTYTGANGTSDESYTNVSKVVVKYCTNVSDGVGTIKVQVGSGTEKSFSVTKPAKGTGTTIKDAEFIFSPSETGKVKITAECTTNSVYINGVTITAN